VIDILHEKHPEARVPPDSAFDIHEDAEKRAETSPVYYFEETVAKCAGRLRGAAGPIRVDGLQLKSWCLRFGAHSEMLRNELALWVDLLSNGSPLYASYRALNAARMLAADKRPGVRPLACREILTRLFARCNLEETKAAATAECANVQLSGGLRAGIEGNLHAVRAVCVTICSG